MSHPLYVVAALSPFGALAETEFERKGDAQAALKLWAETMRDQGYDVDGTASDPKASYIARKDGEAERAAMLRTYDRETKRRIT